MYLNVFFSVLISRVGTKPFLSHLLFMINMNMNTGFLEKGIALTYISS